MNDSSSQEPKSITIRMEIPIFGDNLCIGKWMADEEEISVERSCGDVHLRITINPSCDRHFESMKDGKTPRTGEFRIKKFIVFATLTNLEDVTYTHIWGQKDIELNSGMLIDGGGYPAYKAYSTVYQEILTALNELIRLIRSETYQSNLDEHEILREMPEEWLESVNAHLIARDGAAVKLRQKIIQRAQFSFEIYGGHNINKEGWGKISMLFSTGRNGELPRDLIVNAERLAKSQNRRSAVIELVTAMEVALTRFARSPNKDYVAEAKTAVRRMEIDSVKSFLSRRGLTATVSFLLPIIFDEDALPDRIHKACCKAIDTRGAVVHSGKRDVHPNDVFQYIDAVKHLCDLLMRNTIDG